MECLLFGGAQSVGKSNAIYRLATRLITPPAPGVLTTFSTFIDVTGTVPLSFDDFRAVLEGTNNKGKKIRIIINSPTDTTSIIQEFKDFYDNNGTYDILISSVREDSYSALRNDFFRIMNLTNQKDFILELPLGKVRREPNQTVSLGWFERELDNLVEHILRGAPYNL